MNRRISIAPGLLPCCVGLIAAAAGAARLQADDAERVQRAIERGTQALLDRIGDQDVIRYRQDRRNGPTKTVRGRVIRDRGATLEFELESGRKIYIRKLLVEEWKRAGYIAPEQTGMHYGGPSALAALALISAGVKPSHPTAARLLDAMEHDKADGAGTYVHSLRACVWSAILERSSGTARKARYRKLLRDDMQWLMREMSESGAFGYGAQAGRPDNSNTQFANLGMWAGDIAEIELAGRFWLATEGHWMESQHAGRGWSYMKGDIAWPTSSMTVAGCNSLYVVLDRHYSKMDEGYRLFEGARANAKARQKMERIYRAIEDGDRFLTANPPDISSFFGYELFGLERLGLASGQARIGGLDWFRHYAPSVAQHPWGDDPVADAFALIFLVHGQAPVLFQKLEHGRKPDDWNYYHRDLQGLTRYLSRTFERLYRWQRVPVDASLKSLEDAPFLYIGGADRLRLPAETMATIREYIDRGGTMFLHADRASGSFVEGAVETFEGAFADRGLVFEALRPEHPLYRCHFGNGEQAWNRQIPLRAIADGPRLLVVLCPVDLAGAWHQDARRFEDVFRIMANLRVYAARPYQELARVLRSSPVAERMAPPRGKLSILRLRHEGDWNARQGVWARNRSRIELATGIDVHADETGPDPAEAELEDFDIVHLTTRGRLELDRKTVARLERFISGGGLVLIENADGQAAGNEAAAGVIELFSIGRADVLSPSHPICSGVAPGAAPLGALEPTPAGAGLQRTNAAPPILTRVVDGRVGLLACPFDLSAGLDGDFVWRRIGYTRKSTDALVGNILLWRLDEVGGRSARAGAQESYRADE